MSQMEITPSMGVANLGKEEVSKVLLGIEMLNKKELGSIVTAHITSPFDVPTPKEKIKKRPDGYDYIESSWMDKNFKEHSSLYSNELVHYSESMGWITIVVKLTDRITGNSELGGSSVRIQVRQGTLEPTFRDIIDKGNNVAACLSKAIKNAQSRFGHGADVYGKRESVRTKEESERYASMLKQITSISTSRAQLFKEGWEQLGVDFSEYLDKWQIYIDINTNNSAEAPVANGTSDPKVTELKSQMKTNKKSNASNVEKLKI